jgi:hypothetical protein
MGCSICSNLERTYEAVLSEYVEARSSVRYRVSTVLAAQKNVDMERARYELEEHRRVCSFAVVPTLMVGRERPTRPTRSRSLAA